MADALASLPSVREVPPGALAEVLASANEPVVIRGLVREWPLVQAGLASAREARAYLSARARAVDLPVSIADPEQAGRLFYDDAMAVNFRMSTGRLPDILAGFDKAEERAADDVPTVYLGSIDMLQFFDGLHEANRVDLVSDDALASIWIGNETRIAAHNDFPRNLACCAVGERRFTLFPPDQFANLYLGPIDITPAGRPVSMVDFDKPDINRHPNYQIALESAQNAHLCAGDAIFIPPLWYHQVEALNSFNVLVNYWWRDTPRYLGQPQTALTHAIMAIRDLPEDERAVWRQMFEHYVFSGGEQARAHIPQPGQGILAPLDANAAQRVHQFLLRSLTK